MLAERIPGRLYRSAALVLPGNVILEFMFAVLALYILLVAMAFLAGYLPSRRLGRGIAVGERWALMPLLGAGTIAVVMLWVHTFAPLSRGLALVGLAPVAAGMAAVACDLAARRWRFRKLPVLVWVGVLLAGSVLTLAPFFMLGSATSFGIGNNDAFWYTQADWRVQKFSYLVPPEHIDSTLARYPASIQRYGLDYLSVLVQSITGLRSWQVVHLTGAFGMLLVVLAAALLARRMRVWWPMVVPAALAAAGNHFMYRLYLDAFIAFPFGLAFLLTICWFLASPPVTGRSNAHVLLLALLFAALSVFYFDILPICVVISGLMIAFGRKPDFDRFGMLSLSALAALVMAAPTMLVIAHHLRTVAASSTPGTYFSFPNRLAGFCSLMGTMNLYELIRGEQPNPLQVAGATVVLLLLLHTLWRLRLRSVGRPVALLYTVPLGALFAFLLFVKGNEYSAHRVYAMEAAIVPMLILGGFGGRLRQPPKWRLAAAAALLFVAALSVAAPAVRLLSDLHNSKIQVTALEKEIGDDWITKLPGNSRILIDAGDDMAIFYPHYLYWETLYGTRFDEQRVVFPAHRYAYITPAPPLEALDLGRCTHVLRRRDLHEVEGDLKVLRSNARYELLAGTVFYYFGTGFYGPEAGNSRWLRRDGEVGIVSAQAGQAEFTATLYSNPASPDGRVSFGINGVTVDQGVQLKGTEVRLSLPLSAGRNRLTVHSLKEPVQPNALDTRPLSVRFASTRIRAMDVLQNRRFTEATR